MNLKTVRTKRGMTQEQLADRSGVDQSTICAIETQRMKRPSWFIVARLAKALECEPEELFPVEMERA